MYVKLCLAFCLLGLAACETVGGAGRDIQSAGRALERESYEVRQ